MTRSTTRPRRRLAAGAAASGLLLGTLAVAGGGAATAAPAGCDQPFPVADLAKGDSLEGLTVVTGTEPVSFTGTVLGVMEDGIAMGVDMILVDVDVPDIELPGGGQAGGIWQGMSGSPLYAADGRLVGAISYGLTWGSSPIAGVTAFEDMDRYLATEPAARVAVPGPLARTIAARTDVTAAQAARGLRPLSVPLGVSGVSQRTLDAIAAQVERLAKKGVTRPYLKSASYRLSRTTGAAADASDIVPGGNLGTTASYGDVTMGGVGTVTAVCGDRVVGFGHPAYGLGSTSLGLNPADAIYVQPDSAGSPFKVANLAPPVGTIDDDRSTAIAGVLGTLPEGIALTSELTLGGESHTARTDVYVDDAAADALYYQYTGGHDRLLDYDPLGSELLTWTITGTDRSGQPFTLGLTNRYAGGDALWEAAYGVADYVWRMSTLSGVSMDSVDLRATATRDDRTLTISRLEHKRQGSWHKVGKKAPIQARAGRPIALRVVLTGDDGTTRYRNVSFTAPAARYGNTVRVGVGSGTSVWTSTNFRSVAAAKKLLAETLRNDQVRVQLGTRDKVRGGSSSAWSEMYFRTSPKSPKSFVRTKVSAPYDQVVTGGVTATVKIRR